MAERGGADLTSGFSAAADAGREGEERVHDLANLLGDLAAGRYDPLIEAAYDEAGLRRRAA